MLPEWILKILEGMGVHGAIIFVLLTTIGGLVAYIRSMQKRADKIYGYRLAERDTLNKAMTDSAGVLADLLKAQEDRNDLTEEQAELISKMSTAFELLKVTILAQYDNIREHNHAAAQAVTSMADAIRALTAIVVENRTIAANHVQDVKSMLQVALFDISKSIRESSQTQIVEMRSLLGTVTTVHRKRIDR